MAMTSELTADLDKLLASLESAGASTMTTRPNDAIDEILGAPPRTSAVRSLRDAPEVEAFRTALIDGLIRTDTVNQLLRLINEIVVRFVR